MKVRVRRATPDDAREIAKIHVVSWRAAYRGIFPDEVLDTLSVEGRTREWTEWLAPGAERSFTLVAEVHGTVQGFATLETPSQDEEDEHWVGMLRALYLPRSAWGTGVGVALLHSAAAEMHAAGCREAVLWMLEGNDRAARFYRREGWELDGARRGSDYYDGDPGIPEVRWRRSLEEGA